MTNIKIETEIKNETVDSGVIHTDYLIDQNDSGTEYDVIKLLNAMPEDLKHIAINKYGFHIISENQLLEFIKYSLLTNSAFVDGMYDKLKQNFEKYMLSSLKKYFQNDIIEDYGVYEIEDDLLNEIAQFVYDELIAKTNLTINDEKIIIESRYDETLKYSEKVSKIDWIEKFYQSQNK